MCCLINILKLNSNFSLHQWFSCLSPYLPYITSYLLSSSYLGSCYAVPTSHHYFIASHHFHVTCTCCSFATPGASWSVCYDRPLLSQGGLYPQLCRSCFRLIFRCQSISNCERLLGVKDVASQISALSEQDLAWLESNSRRPKLHSVATKALGVFFPSWTSVLLYRFQMKALLWQLWQDQSTNQLRRLCCSRFEHQ